MKNVAPGSLSGVLVSINPANLPSNAPDLTQHPISRGLVYRQWGAYVQQPFYTYVQGVSTALLYVTEIATQQ